MVRWILAVSLILVILGTVFGGLYVYRQPPSQLEYSGKVIFQTEKEYRDFKDFVGRRDVIIQKVDILASTPPVVVTYDIIVPAEATLFFEYDEVSQTAGGPIGNGVAIFVFGGMISFVLAMALFSKL